MRPSRLLQQPDQAAAVDPVLVRVELAAALLLAQEPGLPFAPGPASFASVASEVVPAAEAASFASEVAPFAAERSLNLEAVPVVVVLLEASFGAGLGIVAASVAVENLAGALAAGTHRERRIASEDWVERKRLLLPLRAALAAMLVAEPRQLTDEASLQLVGRLGQQLRW